RTLTGHARMARRVAAPGAFHDYDGNRVFCSDDAPEEIVGRRPAGLERLAGPYYAASAGTVPLPPPVTHAILALPLTHTHPVPFQCVRVVRQQVKSAAFVRSSARVMLTDLDGNQFYDLTGSYGVNVLGYDFYKQAVARAVERVGELGPVLGPYHPVIADNVKRLKEISGLDEVSFHMSGTEAV